MITIIAFLIAFSLVVIVHESGHLMAAKRAGVRVYEFSIGFPLSPRLLTLFRHRETELTIRCLPIGGFVSFSKEGSADDAEGFLELSRGKRAFIASSGPALNIVFAFMALAASSVIANNDLPGGLIGGIRSIEEVTAGTFYLLIGLFSGGSPLSALSGPIGIGVMAGKAAHAGLSEFLRFTGNLSLSLGILNLLPLPALDGGHLAILGAESVFRRRLNPSLYAATGLAGISFFIIITLLVSYADILRLMA